MKPKTRPPTKRSYVLPPLSPTPSFGDTRKDRNKYSAARSRANRKAKFEEMAQTISQLQLENAALIVQVNDLLARTTMPTAPQATESPRQWIVLMEQDNNTGASGGIQDESRSDNVQSPSTNIEEFENMFCVK